MYVELSFSPSQQIIVNHSCQNFEGLKLHQALFA